VRRPRTRSSQLNFRAPFSRQHRDSTPGGEIGYPALETPHPALARAIETEIKIRIDEPERIRAALRDLGARRVRERHLEDNVLYDDPRGALRSSGSVLRLRRTPGAAVLTYKGPRKVDGGVRSRPETETSVADPDALHAILLVLGLRPGFRYQKYREVYVWEGQEIVVDETPIGAFMEIEGDHDGIARAAARLGFSPRDYVVESYVALFFASGGKGDMVFP
jgi:adenylate cyclase, class 2